MSTEPSDELALRDHDSSSWCYVALLEFISVAENPQKMSILYHELRHPHPFAYHTALRELLRIRGVKTHWILSDALSYQFDTEEETQEFHKALKNEK